MIAGRRAIVAFARRASQPDDGEDQLSDVQLGIGDAGLIGRRAEHRVAISALHGDRRSAGLDLLTRRRVFPGLATR